MNFNRDLAKFFRIIFVFNLVVLAYLISTISLKAQSSNPGSACGFTQPDAQMWGNCAGEAGPSCRTDPTQLNQPGGWYGGSDINNQNYVTSPDNPLWMQVQCFVELSFGRGGMDPAYIEIVNVDTGSVVASMYRGWGDNTALKTQLANPGTYRANCYNGNRTCLASYDTFRIGSRCTPTDPNPSSLTSPANGALVALGANNGVDVVFNNSTGWGKGCPQNNTYRIQLQPNCSGSWIDSYGQTTRFTNLSKGVTYCWRVRKHNGSRAVQSEVRRFTVIDDTTTISSSGTQADVCGGGFSGIAGSPAVSNPIDYNLNFTTASGNTYREVWLAAVPDNVTYNNCPNVTTGVCQNKESLDVQTESIILAKANAAKTFAFRIILDGAGNASQVYAYNGGSWGAPVTGGNATSLGATLLNFRADSTASVSGQNLVSRFRIRYDTAPLGKYRYYAAALISDVLGNVKTSYSTINSQRVYKRLTASASQPNWGVDLTPPAIQGANFKAVYQAANRFTINWSFTEANGVQFKSFVTRDTSDSSLSENSGAINFGVPLPNVAQYDSGALNYGSITTWNGYVVNGSVPINRTYTDADPSKQSNYQFYAFTRDGACNQKVITTSAALQKPWVVSYNGNVSAAQGITGISIPQSLNEFSADIKGKNNLTILTDRKSVYLSSYGAISGTADLPLRKQSKYSQYNLRYEDLTIKPPLDSGITSWYTYLNKLVTENKAAPIATLGTNLSGRTSAYLSVAANSKKHAVVAGTLTVQKDVICDTQTIFFVDALVINPDFRVQGNNNGCLFVSKGNITIENGDRASAATPIDDPALANYDVIEAALITDAQLITRKDVANNAQKGDGLVIKGSVQSLSLNLLRDINLNANQFQPAHLFYFDPRYRQIFKSDINYNKYSIREVGFTNN